MLLFRDEEHVEEWCRARGREPGGLLTPPQLWDLARTWYRGRMAPGWRRRTSEEAQAVFDSIGLTGDFWSLG